MSGGFSGARNDKTVVTPDEFIMKIKTARAYKDFEYDIYVSNEEKKTWRELHCLGDGATTGG
jgi:hypothetical protein